MRPVHLIIPKLFAETILPLVESMHASVDHCRYTFIPAIRKVDKLYGCKDACTSET